MSNEKGFIAYINVFLMLIIAISLSNLKLVDASNTLKSNAYYFKTYDLVFLNNFTNDAIIHWVLTDERKAIRVDNSKRYSYNAFLTYKSNEDGTKDYYVEARQYPGYMDGTYKIKTYMDKDGLLIKIKSRIYEMEVYDDDTEYLGDHDVWENE